MYLNKNYKLLLLLHPTKLGEIRGTGIFLMFLPTTQKCMGASATLLSTFYIITSPTRQTRWLMERWVAYYQAELTSGLQMTHDATAEELREAAKRKSLYDPNDRALVCR